LHGSADVFVATIDFDLAWQLLLSERSPSTARHKVQQQSGRKSL
jgi:hypothetical protein